MRSRTAPAGIPTPERELSRLVEAHARRIAREEVASLSALVLRRLRDLEPGVIDRTELAGIFGEALRDFGGTPDEPGPKQHELHVGGEIAREGETAV